MALDVTASVVGGRLSACHFDRLSLMASGKRTAAMEHAAHVPSTVFCLATVQSGGAALHRQRVRRRALHVPAGRPLPDNHR